MNLIFVGPVYEATGYAEVNRNLLLSLARLGINIRLKPLSIGRTIVPLDRVTREALRRMAHNAFVNKAIVLQSAIGIFFESDPANYTIGLTMLECDRIPAEWVRRCNLMNEVWVPSRFNKDTFTSSGVNQSKIMVMPLGVDVGRFNPHVSPTGIAGRRGFNFLSVFEWVPRKGYDILIRAYFEEFSGYEDVCLIIKAHDNSCYDPEGVRIREEIDAMKRAVGKGDVPPVVVLPAVIPREAMPGLYKACDCFVSPTRGEGWHLPAIEAMAVGLPAICTNWSGHLEFMNPGNSFLINIDGLEPVPACGIQNDSVYRGANWAVPSLQHLRALMRHVFSNRDAARATGRKASAEIAERFSWEAAAGRMYQRLAIIDSGGGPPWRGLRRVTPPAAGVRADYARPGQVARFGLSGFKPRVAMVVPSWGKQCGVAEYAKALVSSLTFLGCDTDVISSLGGVPAVALGKKANLVHFQFQYALYDVRMLENIVRQLVRSGVPTVLTLHDFDPVFRDANRVMRNEFNKIIIHSALLKPHLISTGVPEARIRVIPIGCYDFPLAPEGETRARLGMGNGIAIGFFGFAFPQKGVGELAVAVRELRKTHPDLRCFIFSPSACFQISNDYAGELRSFLDQNGLWDGMTLLSEFVPEMETVQRLHAMDINVLPYHNQGSLGTSAAVRTMIAARKPIIVTDVPCFADLGGEVYKVPSPDPGHIVAAIEGLLNDPGKRSELVQAMDAYVRTNSWLRVAERHVDFYRQVGVEARPRPQPVPDMVPTAVPVGVSGPDIPAWMLERVVARFARNRR